MIAEYLVLTMCPVQLRLDRVYLKARPQYL